MRTTEIRVEIWPRAGHTVGIWEMEEVGVCLSSARALGCLPAALVGTAGLGQRRRQEALNYGGR